MNDDENIRTLSLASRFRCRMRNRMRGVINCRSRLGERNVVSEEIGQMINNRLDASRDEKKSYPLRLAGERARVRIISLTGGTGFHDRLAGAGLGIGVEVEVIKNPGSGRMLLGRDGIRFYLGGGMAHRIFVTDI